MSTYPLAKPKTATNSIVDVIAQPTATSGDGYLFRVKPSNVSLSFSVEAADVTGADDTKAVFTHNLMTRGQFQIQGYAVGDSALNLSKLQSEYNGAAHGDTLVTDSGSVAHPTSPVSHNIRFNYSSGKYLYCTALIRSIQLSYNRSSPFVAVAMECVITKTDLGNAANVDVSS